MSLALACTEGVEVKTEYTYDVRPRHLFTMWAPGKIIEVSMDEAVAELDKGVGQVQFEDPVLFGLKRYLKSMYPVRRPSGEFHLEPHHGLSITSVATHMSGERIQFFDQDIRGNDFAVMAHYVMTNSRIQMPHLEGYDPRVEYTNRLRGDIE